MGSRRLRRRHVVRLRGRGRRPSHDTARGPSGRARSRPADDDRSPARNVPAVIDDPSSPPLRDPSIGVHRFSDRLAGQPVDDVLRREVSSHLAEALHAWLNRFGSIIGHQFVSRAAARLDLSPDRQSPNFFLLEGFDLLDLVDQVIDLSVNQQDSLDAAIAASGAIGDLQTIFDDHRSLYTIGEVNRKSGIGLLARVDPAVQEAVSHLVHHQTGSAGQHLTAAWGALHQLHPDPAASYSEAIRAIEAALGPIVLPNAKGPTLGQIKYALKTNTWASVLDRTGPDGKLPSICEATRSSVVFLIDLLERVYGTHARHGCGDEHREQTQTQAAAAVYAAVAILGWTQTGLLVRV
jgi:hypothetical protein